NRAGRRAAKTDVADVLPPLRLRPTRGGARRGDPGRGRGGSRGGAGEDLPVGGRLRRPYSFVKPPRRRRLNNNGWKIMKIAGRIGVALLLSVGVAPQVLPADWPQFRGPNCSGRAGDARLPADIGPNSNLIWKAALPP